MTGRRQFQVTHSQESLLTIVLALGFYADMEYEVGDHQKALYARFLRATLMNGVLEDDPADSAS